MDYQGNQESDYCDLDPSKICDNCCRCLDMDKPYNEVEISLLRTDHIIEDIKDNGNDTAFPFVFCEEEDEGCDPSRISPFKIDPALRAEWENRLKAYEAEQKAAYMRTLHGTRKRTERDG